jgi:hypothetical protein
MFPYLNLIIVILIALGYLIAFVVTYIRYTKQKDTVKHYKDLFESERVYSVAVDKIIVESATLAETQRRYAMLRFEKMGEGWVHFEHPAETQETSCVKS